MNQNINSTTLEDLDGMLETSGLFNNKAKQATGFQPLRARGLLTPSTLSRQPQLSIQLQ